jgi:hypothetical protein
LHEIWASNTAQNTKKEAWRSSILFRGVREQVQASSAQKDSRKDSDVIRNESITGESYENQRNQKDFRS